MVMNRATCLIYLQGYRLPLSFAARRRAHCRLFVRKAIPHRDVVAFLATETPWERASGKLFPLSLFHFLFLPLSGSLPFSFFMIRFLASGSVMTLEFSRLYRAVDNARTLKMRSTPRFIIYPHLRIHISFLYCFSPVVLTDQVRLLKDIKWSSRTELLCLSGLVGDWR